MKDIIIYTDGGCRGNPGIGAWSCILIRPDTNKKLELSGFKSYTTNNEMELTAVIEALKQLKKPCNITICSDSLYVVNGLNSWLYNWQKNGWKTKEGTVKNLELWKQLFEYKKFHIIKAIWVKGHAENELNNRCDELLNLEMDKNK